MFILRGSYTATIYLTIQYIGGSWKRSVSCKKCKKTNYNDFTTKNKLFDKDIDSFVSNKEEGHMYEEGDWNDGMGKRDTINMVLPVGLILILVLFILGKLGVLPVRFN